MRQIILTSLLLWVSALAHADYSRLYFDHMPAATTQSGNTDITYRVFNRGEENPKLLLIMGLGGAGAAWGDAFLRALEFEGFEVIVIDNRDTGSSAMFTEWGKPTLWWQLLKYELGFSVDAPYDLNDMAADSIAVLDDAGYDQVHVMGVSMGGMIAQVLAAQYPERVTSLTSIMSTTFAPHLPPQHRRQRAILDPSQRATLRHPGRKLCATEASIPSRWSVISWRCSVPAIEPKKSNDRQAYPCYPWF